MHKKLSRRAFMRNAGLLGTGMTLAACVPVPPVATVTPVAPQDSMEGETEAVAELAVEELEVAYVFDYDPTGADAWVAADEEFVQYFAEKYPNYVVVREQTPWTGFTEKLLTSIAGGSRYDVIYGYWQWLPLFIENDVVGPLDDLIDADTTIAADDFFDYAKETVEGDTYGLAWFISGWLHWYNMTAVNEAGYTTPKEMNENGEWDYDAWFQFATDFTSREGGVPIYGYDMASARGVSVYAMLAWAWGTQQWSDDFATSLMNSRENVALWKWIRQFYRDGLAPLPRDRTPDRPLSFTNGRAMATMAGQWYTRNIVQDGAPDLFDIGMAPFPKGPSGQYSVAALNSFYFSKSPGNVDPAWAWYKERSFSEAVASIYAKIGGGGFPSIKRVASATVYEWEDAEVYEAIRPRLRTYRTSPKESEWIDTLWNPAWDEMVLGRRPVEEILGQLAQESTDLVYA